MKPSRNAALAAASLLTALTVAPTFVMADDQQPGPGKEKKHEGEGKGEPRQWQQGKPPGQPPGAPKNFGQQGGRPEKQRPQGFGQQPPPNAQPKNFGQQGRPEKQRPQGFGQQPPPNAQPKNFGQQGVRPEKQRPQGFGQQQLPPNAQPKPPAVNNAVVPQQQQPQQPHKHQNAGPQNNFNNQFGGQNRAPNNGPPPAPPQNQQGWKRPTPGTQPAPVVNPGQPNRPGTPNFVAPNKPPQTAAEAKRRFEAMRGQRKEVKFDGGKGVVIEEPGKRRIYRENNRVFIQHDDTERLRRVAPNARFERGKGGMNVAVIDRPGGYKIYSETDANGQLIRRYRRGPDGRDFIIIDNRRRRHDNFGRNLAAGIGIGVGVVAGAAILNSMLDVPPPRVTIPRDEYIVDYERASDEDVYEALSAPPVEDFRGGYTLDEIRATAALRDRMRRVDLDDITFDFGSWEVNPSEYGKLDRIARAMRRIINRNPNEVFMIEGYTDAVGSPEDNLSLSDRRAESVAEVLSQQFQIPFENLTTQGYGEEYLKVPTQAPERLNRRVAVRRITPLLARGNAGAAPPPPPPQGSGQYDDGPGGPGDGGPADGGPDDGGPDDQGYDGPPPERN